MIAPGLWLINSVPVTSNRSCCLLKVPWWRNLEPEIDLAEKYIKTREFARKSRVGSRKTKLGIEISNRHVRGALLVVCLLCLMTSISHCLSAGEIQALYDIRTFNPALQNLSTGSWIGNASLACQNGWQGLTCHSNSVNSM